MSKNLLYYGDNLDILRRHVADESVDLVYLDPPFKSNQDYNVLFAERDGSRAAAQIKAFDDDREKAAIGVLLTMNSPTKPMRAEAASVGSYISPFGGAKFRKMQILTVEELLDGKRVEMPWHERVSSVGK